MCINYFIILIREFFVLPSGILELLACITALRIKGECSRVFVGLDCWDIWLERIHFLESYFLRELAKFAILYILMANPTSFSNFYIFNYSFLFHGYFYWCTMLAVLFFFHWWASTKIDSHMSQHKLHAFVLDNELF